MSSSWSHTLQLPKSQLANRSNAKLITKNLDRVTSSLYKWQHQQTQRPTKVLHDGPPYANGELHMGHALNKVLKDIVNRYAVSAGFRVAYRPGWDCHGLPIEHTALKKAKKRRDLTVVDRRTLARNLAREMVERQQTAFVGFGVMADWTDPEQRYLTLTSDYVVRELRVFSELVSRGLVFRQRKPVFWSVESGTALAESELVYGDREATAAYIAYPLEQPFAGINNVELAIWTTTPWTLPANEAIAVNEGMDYCILRVASKEPRFLLVAESLAESLQAALGLSGGEIVKRGIKGSELVAAGLTYACPLRQERGFPVIAAEHVVDTAGTGLVHTAPGHGKEDFVAGQKHGLPVSSPVDGRGRYTAEVRPSELTGLDARTDGSARVLSLLREGETLLASSPMTHSVPLDWRTKTPVMARATPQFFIDVGHEVRALAIKALDNVSFRPETGRHRLQAFTQSRTDWCISRQRAWGVPIPALYVKHQEGNKPQKEEDELLMTAESIEHIISRIADLGEGGVDAWFQSEEDIEQWLPPSMQNQGLGTKYRKGTDTLDVWLDSGTSWTMLPQTPADIYLEGSDQHRGWFQSSLLTHVAVTGKAQAPFKRLITHGFVLDEQRQKMSKSLGNVVAPDQIIKTVGIDGLRLLLAQSDYTSDVTLSQTTTSQVAAMLKKFRLTFKFLLGNLADFEHSHHDHQKGEPPAYSTLDLDAINKLNKLIVETRSAYDEQNFQTVVKLVQAHMNADLSSLYFDAVKDVLYADAITNPRRRAVQTVLYQILDTYERLTAPIIPLLTQEVWDLCPPSMTRDLDSPLMAGYPSPLTSVPVKKLESASATVAGLLGVRDLVNDALEKARADKRVGSSLACDVYVNTEDLSSPLEAETLETLCVVSQVKVNVPELPANPEWMYTSKNDSTIVTITPPSHHKCPRCWKYTSPAEDVLCHRCEDAVQN